LTLDGFSMWALTYLMTQGLDIPRIKAFGDAARPLLVDGFDERPVDVTSEKYRALLDACAGAPLSVQV
jgi:hypothetical protein